MGKLVRDGIPDFIRNEGRAPHVRVLTLHQYENALLLKVVEEATELRDAEPGQRLEEMGDVLEVLEALATALGFTWEDVRAAADAKRDRRGGFAQRLWLETL